MLTLLFSALLLQTTADTPPDPLAGLTQDNRAAVWQAIDRRDPTDKAIITLPPNTKGYALGMIGTDDACNSLVDQLSSAASPLSGSIAGLALCRREEDAAILVEALSAYSATDNATPLNWPLIGAHMSEPVRDYMVNLIAQESTPSVALIDGVMHSFAYTRPAITDLPPWDIGGQITALDALGSFQQRYAIRFALSRLKPLNALPAVQGFAANLSSRDLSALSNDDIDLSVFEIRSLQPGEPLTRQVRDHILAKGPDRLRQEVLRFYAPGSARDADILLAIATDDLEPVGLRAFAIGRFSAAKDLAPETLTSLKTLINNDNAWIAVRALQVVSQFEPKTARTIAATWLEGEDDYKRLKAASLLAGDEMGSSFLRGVAARKKDSELADLIEMLLQDRKPSEAADQPTPSFQDARAALGFIVTLDTTKGPVEIGFKPTAPFAAYNFYQLAKDGLMNGMVFHRVIPNFVAQWGESLTKEAYEWANIRDNWLYGWHRYGSVGVATAGKDTGSSQFFINLVHNRTLDHRYSVVGQVLSGMGIVEQIEEGDHIIGVQIKPVGDNQQQDLIDMLKPMPKVEGHDD